MSALFYLICISVFELTTSYTLIPDSGFWTDDFVYHSNATSYTSSSESWWYDGSYGVGVDLDGTGYLADTTMIHGWFRKTSTETSDKIGRDFKCPHYSNVEVLFHSYFCVDGRGDGDTTMYYFRTNIGAPIDLQYERTADGWTEISAGGNGICGVNVKRASIVDTFTVFAEDLFSITINKQLEYGSTSNDDIVAGFRIESITCHQIPTPTPTKAPSLPTETPSKAPSKQPSATPSEAPSKTPSKAPSKPPSESPTKKPTMSHHPTTTPSKSPTRAPTESPTRKPTDAPTKKPTMKPSESPSKPPTKSVTKYPSTTPTALPTESPTSWVDCVDETISFSGTSMDIFIKIDAVNQQMELVLTGPKSAWFGIGFGSDTMSQTFTITVGSAVTARRLRHHLEGEVISNVFDDATVDVIGGSRWVTMQNEWTMNGIFDFSDFFDGNMCTLPIIWAAGSENSIELSYHGSDNRGSIVLNSCMCTESPATAEPTKAPTMDAIGGNANDIRCSSALLMVVCSFFLLC